MKVAIAGAGNVGRSIAHELCDHHHDVLLIEISYEFAKSQRLPQATWLCADACEMTALEQASLADYEVFVAATGDDKVNLVASLLAKTEFGIPRVVARVNKAENEWLFTEQWGVDVAVSKPRVLAALVEEAVSIGELVRIMTFRQGQANLVEITLDSLWPGAGTALDELVLPQDTALVAIVRGPRVITPSPQEPLEAGDELIFLCQQNQEHLLTELFGVSS